MKFRTVRQSMLSIVFVFAVQSSHAGLIKTYDFSFAGPAGSGSFTIDQATSEPFVFDLQNVISFNWTTANRTYGRTELRQFNAFDWGDNGLTLGLVSFGAGLADQGSLFGECANSAQDDGVWDANVSACLSTVATSLIAENPNPASTLFLGYGVSSFTLKERQVTSIPEPTTLALLTTTLLVSFVRHRLSPPGARQATCRLI